MILENVDIPERKTQVFSESGIDSLKFCKNQKHFKAYPYDILYKFNSRGFRDDEWPEDLTDSIWCIGDSYTVGIGSPINHTWPRILQEKTRTRCINVSLDGASNQWISRRACQILEEIQPKIMVIHWSHIHRSELPDQTLSDCDRRVFLDRSTIDVSTQIEMFIKNIQCVMDANKQTKIVHSTIPEAVESVNSVFENWTAMRATWDQLCSPEWPSLPTTIFELNHLPEYVINELKCFGAWDLIHNSLSLFNTPSWVSYSQLTKKYNFITNLNVLDLARDGHHYDILTATTFVKRILEKIKK